MLLLLAAAAKIVLMTNVHCTKQQVKEGIADIAKIMFD